MSTRNAIDDAGQAEDVVGSSPRLAGLHQACSQCPVDVGKLVGFHLTIGEPDTDKNAKVRIKLLLQVETDAGTAAVLADGRDVGRLVSDLSPTARQRYRCPCARD